MADIRNGNNGNGWTVRYVLMPGLTFLLGLAVMAFSNERARGANEARIAELEAKVTGITSRDYRPPSELVGRAEFDAKFAALKEQLDRIEKKLDHVR